MKQLQHRVFIPILLTLSLLLPGLTQAQQIDASFNVFEGHFSREGNNGSPAQTTKNNLYIKLYPDNWIALLYVPYPYGEIVTADIIDRVYVEARKQIKQRSFTRNTFAVLDEPATVHMEKWAKPSPNYLNPGA